MERTRLDGQASDALAMPPGWTYRQAVPHPADPKHYPCRWYAVAPYPAHKIGFNLEQTVSAEDPVQLMAKAWEQQRRYDNAVQR